MKGRPTTTHVGASCRDCEWTWDEITARKAGRPSATPIPTAREAVRRHVDDNRHRVTMRLLTVQEFAP